MVLQGIQQQDTREIDELLESLIKRPEASALFKAFAGKLVAILAGNRSPDLAADNELDYLDAADLLLLLEQLKSS